MAARAGGPLASAATVFEADLSLYEELTADLARMSITSEKTLARAKKQLEESAECQLRLADHLKVLVAAVEGSRAKQEACMEQVLAAARRVETRSLEHRA